MLLSIITKHFYFMNLILPLPCYDNHQSVLLILLTKESSLIGLRLNCHWSFNNFFKLFAEPNIVIFCNSPWVMSLRISVRFYFISFVLLLQGLIWMLLLCQFVVTTFLFPSVDLYNFLLFSRCIAGNNSIKWNCCLLIGIFPPFIFQYNIRYGAWSCDSAFHRINILIFTPF